VENLDVSRSVDDEFQRVTTASGKTGVGVTKSDSAFGDMSLCSFDRMLEDTKDDAGTGNMFVAVLHMLTASTKNGLPVVF
jgi:hypothetical protein